jgi:cytochrome b6
MKKLMDWLKERYQIDDLLAFAQKKYVPLHKGFIWYYFGGITLFLFCVQVVTGILLLLYYRPGEDSAFESVQLLLTRVKFGWLIRSLHSWSANLMIFSAFVHMFSNFFTRAYRRPRELTWLTGIIMFLFALAFGFSGYLLPWNELSYFATKVGTDIVGVVPIIGKPLLIFLRSGEDVTGATLSRFFGFHVAVLPALFTLFLVFHLAFVQFQGISEPIHLEGKIERRMRFFPNFALRDVTLWLAVFNFLVLLAVFFPWELGVKADPFQSAPTGIRPEWYFVFMFQTLKFIPAKILFLEGEVLGIIGFALGGCLFVIWPFLDTKSNRKEKQPLVPVLGGIALIYIIVLTLTSYIMD